MDACRHTVQYYETDRMGVTHHSNYVRWMEEARVDFLKQIGWDYEKLEQLGVFSPVTALECRYKAATTFADTVEIAVSVAEYTGIRLKFDYRMTKQDGQTVLEGRSEHCFLNRDGRILKLRREYPELDRLLTELARPSEAAPCSG